MSTGVISDMYEATFSYSRDHSVSLYREYIKERLGDESIETDKGFVTYRYLNSNQVYIIDLFIRPKYRRSNEAARLGDLVCQAAKEKGCNELLGTINPISKGSTDSLKVLLAYGMELQSSSDNLIILRKSI